MVDELIFASVLGGVCGLPLGLGLGVVSVWQWAREVVDPHTLSLRAVLLAVLHAAASGAAAGFLGGGWIAFFVVAGHGPAGLVGGTAVALAPGALGGVVAGVAGVPWLVGRRRAIAAAHAEQA